MANNGPAEFKPGSPHQARREDKSLLRQDNSSAGANHPMLRIVHNADHAYHADRVREPLHHMHTPRHQLPAPDGPGGMLDRTVQAQIGRMLRDIFANVAAEPVPERFVALLAALDMKEKCR